MTVKKEEPLISVLMPVYNSAQYLREALESIVEQTYSNIEIIVVDSSEDGGVSKEILLSYGERVRYFYKEKSGIANALNYGLSKVRGKYVARMDADDISLPERLEKQAAFMEAHPDIGVCGSNIQYIDAGGALGDKKVYPESNAQIIAETFLFCSIAHPSVMFRRELVDQGWKYDESAAAEDYDLWTRMIPTVKFVNLPETLLLYRLSANSTTAVQGKRIKESTAVSRRKLIERLYHIKTDVYHLRDFAVNAPLRPELNEPWCDYVVRQYTMLSQIYEENQKRQVLDVDQMNRVLNARWIWTLGYLGSMDCFRAYSESGLLPDCYSTVKRGRLFLDSLMERYEADTYEEAGRFLEKELREVYQQFVGFCTRKTSFAIYGMGKAGIELTAKYQSLRQEHRLHWELCALADKNIETMELKGWLLNVPRRNLETLAESKLDYIVISTPVYFDEIKQELIAHGIKEASILHGEWMLRNIW